MNEPDHTLRGAASASDLLTVREVAVGWGVSKMTVYRLVHAGKLPCVRIGRSYRLPRDEVERHTALFASHGAVLDTEAEKSEGWST